MCWINNKYLFSSTPTGKILKRIRNNITRHGLNISILITVLISVLMSLRSAYSYLVKYFKNTWEDILWGLLCRNKMNFVWLEYFVASHTTSLFVAYSSVSEEKIYKNFETL